MLGKILGHSPSIIYRWIKQAIDKTEEPQVGADIQEIEFDEMWHFLKKKSQKLWIIKAVDRSTRRTIAWVTGGRDAEAFKRLYEKVKHLKHCRFYTDDWEAFAKVLPQECHMIGKSGTTWIEQDNSNTRQHLSRMTRRAKVVSKKEKMVHGSMELWCALTSLRCFHNIKQFLFLSLGENSQLY